MNGKRNTLRPAASAGLLLALGAAALAALASPAAAAVPGLQIVSEPSESNSQSFKSQTVSCPAGKQVIGTGAVITGGGRNVILDDLVPTSTTVRAGAREDQDGTPANWTVRAFAVCADPLPGYQIVSQTSLRNSDDGKSRSASCPGGTRVLGGGAELTGGLGQVVINRMLPGNTSVDATGFEDQDGQSGNWALRTFAVCAVAPAGLEVQTRTSELNSGSAKSQSVGCSAGREALSAGWDINGATGEAGPNDVQPRTRSVREVAFEEDDGFAGNWSLTARAICATP